MNLKFVYSILTSYESVVILKKLERKMAINVGILGGGQLGRMMAQAAHRLGVRLTILDPKGEQSPAGQLCHESITGSFTDATAIRQLAAQVDLLTVEIEHVNAQVLMELEKEGKTIHPSPETIRLIQDKYRQKEFLNQLEIPVADSRLVETLEQVEDVAKEFGYPFMLKSRTFAYDGNGNAAVHSSDQIQSAWKKLKGQNGMLYAEKWVPYTKELAVMIVRGKNNQVQAYPLTETVQQNNICHTVLAPAQVTSKIQLEAIEMSRKAVQHLKGCGIFGVELFLTADGQVLLNEIAPRPHNSGHYTIEACETDQFEQHLRAVTGMPLGSCELKVGAAMMVNVLGDPTEQEQTTYLPLQRALSIPGAGIHRYGKDGVRAGRKLAHITVTAPTLPQLFDRVCHIDETYVERYRSKKIASNGAQVGIIMGSDSDLPCMKAAAQVLEQFDIPYELTIVSAHRTPVRMYEYATSASARGLRVIIAGAGGAAHLPGMVAALSPLPVIGVPVKTSTLNGQDSLLSIVQMPRGVPVATVAIGNAMNAGLLAIRILGLSDEKYERLMSEFMSDQEQNVKTKIDAMEEDGWSKYLKEKM